MTVHVLMPVFNRLEFTRNMLACLREQQVDEPVALIVIDDGSSDGTAQYLSMQHDVTVLHGDGSLWWGGAMDKGVRYVLGCAAPEDWVLFVNNDTRIEIDFIQCLLDTARTNSPAVVGSVIRDIHAPHRLLSIGPKIDAAWMQVADILDSHAAPPSGGAVSVDAVSGRGVLFPVAALRAVNGMRPRMLPHYLADYELALRMRRAGWQLLVDFSAAVYSPEEYGNAFRGKTWPERLFSVRSPSYLPAQLGFWWQASSFMQKLVLPVRLIIFSLFPCLRKKA